MHINLISQKFLYVYGNIHVYLSNQSDFIISVLLYKDVNKLVIYFVVVFYYMYMTIVYLFDFIGI